MYNKKVACWDKPKMFFDIESLAHTDTVAMIDENDQRFLFVDNNDRSFDPQGAQLVSRKQLQQIAYKYQLVGFNNKHYDDFIVRLIMDGAPAEEVHEASDRIINSDQASWTLGYKSLFGTFDIRSVIPNNVSLKQLAAQIGVDVEEYDLGFQLDRYITVAELNKLLHYNFNDVVATKKVFEHNSIQGKYNQHVQMIKHYLPGQDWAISMTDAQLASRALTGKSHGVVARTVRMKTKFDWMFKGQNVLDLIPDSWRQSLETLAEEMEAGMVKYQQAIADGETPYEAGRKYLKVAVNIDPIRIGDHFELHPSVGGVHCFYLDADGHKVTADFEDVHHRDISGAYGMIAIATNLFGDQITPIYKGFMDDKFAAKRDHDAGKIAATKLATNAPTGEADQPGSDLYNPIAMVENRVMLQILLYTACKMVIENGGDVLSVNTDGLFYRGDETKLGQLFDEWGKHWELNLGYEHLDRYIGKDDNNRVIVNNGSLQEVGGEVSHLNFNPMKLGAKPRIVDNAVVTKLMYPELPMKKIVEQFIKQNNVDLFAWTLKATKNHASVIGNAITQRVNRVMLTTDGVHIGNYDKVNDKIDKFNGLENDQTVTVINTGIPAKVPANLDVDAYVALCDSVYAHWI